MTHSYRRCPFIVKVNAFKVEVFRKGIRFPTCSKMPSGDESGAVVGVVSAIENLII